MKLEEFKQKNKMQYLAAKNKNEVDTGRMAGQVELYKPT